MFSLISAILMALAPVQIPSTHSVPCPGAESEGYVLSTVYPDGSFRCDQPSPKARIQEPYGGCDEAYLYPDSPGADDCRTLGWEIPQGYKPFRDVEGHTDCYIKVGPTSHVRCLDGFTASS